MSTMELPTTFLGLPQNASHVFWLEDRKYRVGLAGLQALALLERMAAAIPATACTTWLLPFRRDVRAAQPLNAKAVLTYVVLHAPRRDVRVLAIWLRGRCGGYLGTDLLSRLIDSPDRTQRKALLRALSRMHAWPIVSRIEQSDPDPRLRNMAACRDRRNVAARLSKFLRVIRPLGTAPRPPRPLVMADSVDLSRRHAEKPLDLIRAILLRIRMLVRGW